jgi:hypothetical protein
MILMMGNEAVARGAWEAGAVLGTGYPGTPSSEIPAGRPSNVCLLGMLSVRLPFPAELWNRVLTRSIREELRDLNRRAFRLGRERALSGSGKQEIRG